MLSQDAQSHAKPKETWGQWAKGVFTKNKLAKATGGSLTVLFGGLTAWLATIGTEYAPEGELAKIAGLTIGMVPEGIAAVDTIQKMIRKKPVSKDEKDWLIINSFAFAANGAISAATAYLYIARFLPQLLELPIVPAVCEGAIDMGPIMFAGINAAVFSKQRNQPEIPKVQIACTTTTLGTLFLVPATLKCPPLVGAGLMTVATAANAVSTGMEFFPARATNAVASAEGAAEQGLVVNRRERMPLLGGAV
ncbi:MAG: hypothetical protein A2103_01250 [Gammaproteobacteria bacterium GWF2_41_13]|nr:MAG: hypothetical protein A2103_01250 [Gammaproteobacteria bacterium GWF2_41_13]